VVLVPHQRSCGLKDVSRVQVAVKNQVRRATGMPDVSSSAGHRGRVGGQSGLAAT
jgi:hypothetical protein